MCFSKLIRWNFTIPELVNPSDSAGQLLPGAFVGFVANIRVLGLYILFKVISFSLSCAKKAGFREKLKSLSAVIWVTK